MIAFDYNRCVGCGSCVRLCPMGYLKLEEKRPVVRERRRCIECGHCAAACPKQAVTLTSEKAELGLPKAENELEELILSRRSIRHFQAKVPPRELIQRALDLAEYAPSGKNAHQHRWTVLYGLEETEKVTEMALDFSRRTGEAKELIKIKEAGTNLLTCDAPCVILAWSPDDALNPVADPALALTIGGFFPRMGAASTFIWAFVAAAGAGLCVVLLQKGETEDAEKQDFRVRQDA